MSFNRLKYDSCAYSAALNENTSYANYILDTVKFHRCDTCRPQLGTVGGTAVSSIQGNLVDLENNLRGIDRPNTHCPSYKWLPVKDPERPVFKGREYIKPVVHPAIDARLTQMPPSCQLYDLPPSFTTHGPPRPPPRC
jgi:hypothetical protein